MHMRNIFTTIALLALGASAVPLDANAMANNVNDAPTKRLEADQGYEGIVKRLEADPGYEGDTSRVINKRIDADQGYEGIVKRADADQGYEGFGGG
ncbi:hypothetical protein SI65_06925 [Aspergillus cristatus]|uniref:Uncharacterized protein n=1 Tax=Aspergillus cristatus TaxID=573508 RepID=A0A1E3B8F1_ASPCR|nr:hypothetical protein SI65_06925 [Aspergillus cristatus]